jgi:hypothetical protein
MFNRMENCYGHQVAMREVVGEGEGRAKPHGEQDWVEGCGSTQRNREVRRSGNRTCTSSRPSVCSPDMSSMIDNISRLTAVIYPHPVIVKSPGSRGQGARCGVNELEQQSRSITSQLLS